MIKKQAINRIAQFGMITKGVVYVLIGTIAFMTAFNIGNKNNDEADSNGAFSAVQDLPAGMIILSVIAAGLFCYMIWRWIQAWASDGEAKKKWANRFRYFMSGVAYGSLGYTALQIIFNNRSDDKNQNQQIAAQLLSQPFGQVLAIAGAIVLAGIGLYQIYYGLSEKYKKHVGTLSLRSEHSGLMLKAGKIGYISRGIVWLIVSYMFLQAALHSKPGKAGGTGKAFDFLESTAYGPYLLGILSAGVILYGIFNFIRARYERFEL